MRNFKEKYRSERSSGLAAACRITLSSISIVFYDIVMKRRYARAVSAGITAAKEVSEELERLFNDSTDVFGISASEIKKIGIAAPLSVEGYMEENFSPENIGLSEKTEIFYIPFISAGIGGSFTASLLTVPDGDCVIADFGRDLNIARIRNGEIKCASFPLNGAFDGSGLESGIPAERGAIDTVRREKDGTLAYDVIGDGDSRGISPCAAAMSAVIMKRLGSLDEDGIMTDRDLFHIGEDFFVSQADIRVIQSDKATAAGALELFSENECKAFFSGEIFSSSAGFRTLRELGTIPECFSKAAFCRDSAEQGIIRCIEDPEELQRAKIIAQSAKDITEELAPELDELYFKYLPFI